MYDPILGLYPFVLVELLPRDNQPEQEDLEVLDATLTFGGGIVLEDVRMLLEQVLETVP